MKIAYWCNLSFRDKYFGYKDTDDLIYIGEVEAKDLEDAFRQFNRIDATVQILDDAEAPSMSVGDVAQILGSDGPGTGDWYSVAGAGFEQIKRPKGTRLVHNMHPGDVIRARVDHINREGW